jgi:hypothetical protein
VSLFFAALMGLASLGLTIWLDEGGSAFNHFEGRYQGLDSRQIVFLQRKFCFVALKHERELGPVCIAEDIVIKDYSVDDEHGHLSERCVSCSCVPAIHKFSPTESNAKCYHGYNVGRVRRYVGHELLTRDRLNVWDGVSLQPISYDRRAIVRYVYRRSCSRVMELQPSIKVRQIKLTGGHRRETYISLDYREISSSLRFPSLPGLLYSEFGSVSTSLSFPRGVASVTSGHDRREQGGSPNQTTQSAEYPSGGFSGVGRISGLPLSAKIGGAVILLIGAALVWVVGANRAYDRGKGWWRTLLASLFGGWLLTLGAVGLLGLSGSY